MSRAFLWIAFACFGGFVSIAGRAEPPGATPDPPQYVSLQKRLASGWNTWDTRSMATHVLLPSGLAVRIGIQHHPTNEFLPTVLVEPRAAAAETVFPGPHSWDGSYTCLRISWKGNDLRIQSAHDGNDLVLLVEPLPSADHNSLPPTVIFSVAFLWNHPGSVSRHGNYIETLSQSGSVPIYLAGKTVDDVNSPVMEPHFSANLSTPIGLSTGNARTLEQIQAVIDRQRSAYRRSNAASGESPSVVDAIETTLSWDTIYEPEHDRVFSPVSRVWSVNWGGYVVFEWDTFFAATMAGIGDRDLAYANVLETLHGETPEGFVPNYARAGDWESADRSEPPVGAITVLGLYRKFHDRWLLQTSFGPLFAWNRWWDAHRSIGDFLTWGSDGENLPPNPNDGSRGTRQGALYESGLDNSPMYDDAAYDPATGELQFADVGLMSLYIADCDALATIAKELGKTGDSRELQGRARRYRASLSTLWDSRTGIFLNKDLSTGRFSPRLSPTNFYPLLAHTASPEQASRMIQEHLLNPHEFWGQWVIPSIARNDPAFKDQNYWRGRIWGPMNYLVYLGLRNYDQPKVRRQFAQKSLDLFLQEWLKNGHVHENYNAVTGSGDDVNSSDPFYHWGALLAYIEYLERTVPPEPGQEE